MRAVVVGLGLAALAAEVLNLPGPVRPVLVLAFVAIGPGYAIAGRLGVDAPTRWLLVVTTSLSVTAVSAEALAIARVWSATWLLGGLVALTVLGTRLGGEHR